MVRGSPYGIFEQNLVAHLDIHSELHCTFLNKPSLTPLPLMLIMICGTGVGSDLKQNLAQKRLGNRWFLPEKSPTLLSYSERQGLGGTQG